MKKAPEEQQESQPDFEKLLKLFHPDTGRAAELYEVMRVKLRSFFRWRGADDPDSMVDEAMDRVLRRVSEGATIHSPSSYFYSVARHLIREESEKKSRLQQAIQHQPDLKLDYNPIVEEADKEDAAQNEQRLTCLKSCLGNLPDQENHLILQYYRHGMEGKSRIRKDLADSLGIPLNALRIRVFRIRARLGICVQKCLGRRKGVKWVPENDSTS